MYTFPWLRLSSFCELFMSSKLYIFLLIILIFFKLYIKKYQEKNILQWKLPATRKREKKTLTNFVLSTKKPFFYITVSNKVMKILERKRKTLKIIKQKC